MEKKSYADDFEQWVKGLEPTPIINLKQETLLEALKSILRGSTSDAIKLDDINLLIERYERR